MHYARRASRLHRKPKSIIRGSHMYQSGASPALLQPELLPRLPPGAPSVNAQNQKTAAFSDISEHAAASCALFLRSLSGRPRRPGIAPITDRLRRNLTFSGENPP